MTANDVVTVTRPSKLSYRLSNFKFSQSVGTNRLLKCFSGQIQANADLTLLQIALATLFLSPNLPEKQLISR